MLIERGGDKVGLVHQFAPGQAPLMITNRHRIAPLEGPARGKAVQRILLPQAG